MCYVFTGSKYDPHLQFGLSQYCFQLILCLAGFKVVSNLCFDKNHSILCVSKEMFKTEPSGFEYNKLIAAERILKNCGKDFREGL